MYSTLSGIAPSSQTSPSSQSSQSSQSSPESVSDLESPSIGSVLNCTLDAIVKTFHSLKECQTAPGMLYQRLQDLFGVLEELVATLEATPLSGDDELKGLDFLATADVFLSNHKACQQASIELASAWRELQSFSKSNTSSCQEWLSQRLRDSRAVTLNVLQRYLLSHLGHIPLCEVGKKTPSSTIYRQLPPEHAFHITEVIDEIIHLSSSSVDRNQLPFCGPEYQTLIRKFVEAQTSERNLYGKLSYCCNSPGITGSRTSYFVRTMYWATPMAEISLEQHQRYFHPDCDVMPVFLRLLRSCQSHLGSNCQSLVACLRLWRWFRLYIAIDTSPYMNAIRNVLSGELPLSAIRLYVTPLPPTLAKRLRPPVPSRPEEARPGDPARENDGDILMALWRSS